MAEVWNVQAAAELLLVVWYDACALPSETFLKRHGASAAL